MRLSQLTRLLMLSPLALWTPAGAAHDGVINVTGKIVDKTCAVSADSKNMLVTLGSVANKQFARAGEGSPYQSFTINLEKCGAAASNVTVTFSGSSDSDDPRLLALAQDTGSATGMGIAIYDGEKKLIPLNQPGASTPLSPGQPSVTLNFYARYLANGDAVASGSANASATFTLNYA